ncbi:MAG: hypothetical protein OQK13_01930 [Gammaproteobacteria bacterium]|nr:hypothetical protein [Gammaproteobacteria bacterium]
MHENPETSVNSAKALFELNKKREKETQKKEAAENKKSQLVSEQVALLKESNKLAAKALEAKTKTEDIIDIKPNFFGLGANLNEVWRRFRKWRSK